MFHLLPAATWSRSAPHTNSFVFGCRSYNPLAPYRVESQTKHSPAVAESLAGEGEQTVKHPV